MSRSALRLEVVQPTDRSRFREAEHSARRLVDLQRSSCARTIPTTPPELPEFQYMWNGCRGGQRPGIRRRSATSRLLRSPAGNGVPRARSYPLRPHAREVRREASAGHTPDYANSLTTSHSMLCECATDLSTNAEPLLRPRPRRCARAIGGTTPRLLHVLAASLAPPLLSSGHFSSRDRCSPALEVRRLALCNTIRLTPHLNNLALSPPGSRERQELDDS